MRNTPPDWEEGFRLQEEFKKILQEPVVPQYVVLENIRFDPDDGTMDV